MAEIVDSLTRCDAIEAVYRRRQNTQWTVVSLAKCAAGCASPAESC